MALKKGHLEVSTTIYFSIEWLKARNKMRGTVEQGGPRQSVSAEKWGGKGYTRKRRGGGYFNSEVGG